MFQKRSLLWVMSTVKADGQFQGYHIEVLSEMSSQEKKCLCISCLFLGGVTYFFWPSQLSDILRCMPCVRCAGHNKITATILSGGHGRGPWAADINFCCYKNSGHVWYELHSSLVIQSKHTWVCKEGTLCCQQQHCVFGCNGVGLIC